MFNQKYLHMITQCDCSQTVKDSYFLNKEKGCFVTKTSFWKKKDKKKTSFYSFSQNLLSQFLQRIAGLELYQGHRGRGLPFLGFGLDALRPFSTFRVFFTTSWPRCPFVTLPSGISAPKNKNPNSRPDVRPKKEHWLGKCKIPAMQEVCHRIKCTIQ